MRIRDAKPDELRAGNADRALSPRQLAIRKREDQIKRAITGLTDTSSLKAVELEAGEKLATIRASVVRVIKREKLSVNMAVKSGVIYLSRGPIPGARRNSK